jgi:hypothetical protein
LHGRAPLRGHHARRGEGDCPVAPGYNGWAPLRGLNQVNNLVQVAPSHPAHGPGTIAGITSAARSMSQTGLTLSDGRAPLRGRDLQDDVLYRGQGRTRPQRPGTIAGARSTATRTDPSTSLTRPHGRAPLRRRHDLHVRDLRAESHPATRPGTIAGSSRRRRSAECSRSYPAT